MGKAPKKKTNPALAARIVEAIDKWSGKSQTAVAKEIDVAKQSITKWRKYGQVSRDNIELLAAACDVNLVWLLTGKGHPKDQNPLAGYSTDQIIEIVLEYLPEAAQDNLLHQLASRATIRRDDS